MVAILDYGLGNIRSVVNAIDLLGAELRTIQDPEELEHFDQLIFPGVGSFGTCIDTLRTKHLDEAVKVFAASGNPVLGICLGMQVMATTGTENGEQTGLELID
ncbi:MAG: imidazole glycerol phosphate synthase subunit HisH, partial [Bacteroidetes bacterium]|nr:imidazole glycerol phosphate synthase subunit HisH [Bacteroidota bacterium]